jgi:hypothetical protein
MPVNQYLDQWSVKLLRVHKIFRAQVGQKAYIILGFCDNSPIIWRQQPHSLYGLPLAVDSSSAG